MSNGRQGRLWRGWKRTLATALAWSLLFQAVIPAAARASTLPAVEAASILEPWLQMLTAASGEQATTDGDPAPSEGADAAPEPTGADGETVTQPVGEVVAPPADEQPEPQAEGEVPADPVPAPEGETPADPATAPEGETPTDPVTAPEGETPTDPVTVPEGGTPTDPVTVPEGETPPDPEGPIPDSPKVHYIVHYKSGMEMGIKAFGFTAVESLDTTLAGTELIEVPASQLDETLAALKADPNVEYVEPNQILRAADLNDPRYAEQFALQLEKAPQAWSLATQALNGASATEVIVAVLDTGVDGSHEDLQGRVLPGFDILTQRAGPEQIDVNGHGTGVAGVIAATANNGIGIAGAAGEFPISILPIKVLDSTGAGTTYDVAKGIEAAVARGARVINLSLGASLPDYPITLARAIESAQSQGAIVVAAAGNEGRSGLEGYYPASLPGVISVHAVDMNGDILPSSNRYGTVGARGQNVLTTAPGNSYQPRTGTSFAASWVSASAALILSAYPGASLDDVIQAAAKSAPPAGCGWSCNWVHTLEAGIQEMAGPPDNWTEVEIVNPDTNQDVRAIGTLPVTVKVTNPELMTHLVFAAYGPEDDETPSVAIGTLQGPAGGGTNPGNLYTIDWDTTGVANGEYLVEVMAYADEEWLDWASFDVIVANELPSGFNLQVYKPGGKGEAAAGAPVTIYHRYMTHEGEVAYEEVGDDLRTDLHGRLNVPAINMTDGNDYLVVVQGSEPSFLYATMVRTPANLILDGSDTQPMTVVAEVASGQPIANQVIDLELLDGSFPESTDPGAVVLRVPALTLDGDGQGTIHLSKGLFNLRLDNRDEAYYLYRRNVAAGSAPALVVFSAQGGTVSTIRATPAGAFEPHSYSMKLHAWDEIDGFWTELGTVSGDHFWTVSPGKYKAEITATFRPPVAEGVLVADQYTLELSSEFTVSAGEAKSLAFGGPLTYQATRTDEGPVHPGSYVVHSHALLDHGLKVVRMWTEPYRTDGGWINTVQTQIRAVVQMFDSLGTQVGQDYSLPLDFTSFPQMPETAVVGDSYTIVHKVNVGPLAGNETGELLGGETTFTVEAEPGSNTAPLTVTVKDRSGMAALIGAEVRLMQRVGDGYYAVSFATTDAAGRALFDSAPETGEYLLLITGESMNPSDPLSPPEPVFLAVPFEPGQAPMAISVNLASYTMQRVNLEVRDPLGQVPDTPYGWTWNYGVYARVGGATAGLDFAESDAPSYQVWVPQGTYYFQAYSMEDSRWGGPLSLVEETAPPARYSLISPAVSVPAALPADGTLVLGGAELVNLLGPESAPADKEPGPIAIFREEVAGAGSGTFSLRAGANQAPLYVLPGVYILVGSVVHNHFDGPWSYFFERRVSLTGSGSPVRWQGDLSLNMALGLDSTMYSAGSAVTTTHAISDSFGNKLIGIYPGRDVTGYEYTIWRQAGMVPLLTEQGALPLSPIQAQSHDQVAPFLSIKDPNGKEIFRYASGREGWFGDDQDDCSDCRTALSGLGAPVSTYHRGRWVVPEGLSGGQYTAVLELGAGPGGMISTQQSFEISGAPLAPQLDPIPSPTRAQEVVVSGKALAGATVTVSYTLGGGEPVTAGSVTAGADQGFSLTVSLAAEGTYRFTATATKEGATGPASAPLTVVVDRTKPQPAQNVGWVSPDEENIRITWEASGSDDVVGYRISRQDGPTVDVPLGSELLFQESGLEPNTEYTYLLVAIDQAGNESDAVTIAAKTIIGKDEEAPAAPANLQLLYLDAEVGVRLTWGESLDNVGTEGYEIWRKTGDAEAVKVGETKGVHATTFTDLLDMAETTFTYTVVAFDLAGNKSDPSAAAEVTTAPVKLTVVSFVPQRNRNGAVKSGSSLSLSALSDPRREARAEIRILSWQDDEGNSLETAAERVLTVTLSAPDDQPTRYGASLPVPPATERILSIRFVLSDKAGHTAEQNVTGLPLGVTGGLTVDLQALDGVDVALANQLLNGGLLSLWSESTKGAAQKSLTGTGSYLLEQLPPASDYRLRVTAPGGGVLLEQTGIRVRGSLTEAVTVKPSLPATLSVTVIDAYRNSVDAAVTVTQADGVAIMHTELARGAWAVLRDRISGEQVTITVKPRVPHLATKVETVTLNPGPRDLIIELNDRPRGTVQGRALDQEGRPIADVTITGSQVIEGMNYTQSTTTNAQGEYSLSLVGGFPASVQGSSPRRIEYASAGWVGVSEVVAGGVATADVPFHFLGTNLVKVSVRSHYLGEEPQIMEISDWRVAVHMHLQVKTSRGGLQKTVPVFVTGIPGDEVTACVDGVEGNLGKGCATGTLDENGRADLMIDLYEGGRILGNVETQTMSPQYSVDLYQQDQAGSWRFVRNYQYANEALRLGVGEPGRYRLTVQQGSRGFEKIVDVAQNQIVDLGTITLLQRNGLDTKGSHLLATPDVAMPGAAISVRAAYKVRPAQPLASASLLIEVPGGTTLVEGSVALNGQAVAAIAEGGAYRIDVGNLAAGASGVLQYQLSVQNEPIRESLLVIAKIRYRVDQRQIEEPIGSALVGNPQVTLKAPTHTDKLTTNLNGRAPSGSTVRVYAGETLLGEGKAAGDGWWRMAVTLPGTGKPADFTLQARADNGSGQIASEEAVIRYAPDRPVVTKVKMRQQDGREVEFDPREGLARFPYVIVPGYPFHFEVEFNHNDSVSSVQVGFNGSGQKLALATYDPVKKAYLATVTLSGYDVGQIVVYYTISGGARFASSMDALPETEAELRNQLPPWLSDIQIEQPPALKAAAATDCSQGSITGEASMRIPKAENASLHSSLQIECGRTLPAGAKQVKDGVPLWNLKHSYNIEGDEVVIRIEGYIDESLLSQDPQEVAQLLQDAASGRRPIRAAAAGAVAFVAANARFGLAAAGIVGKGWGNMDTYEKLDALQSMATECGGAAPMYQNFLNDLNERALAITMTRAVLQAGGFALGAVTGGIGALVIGAVGFGVDLMLNQALNDSIENVRDMMLSDDECKDKDEDQDGDGGGGGGGGGGSGGGPGGGSGGSGDGGPVGDPTPIWDPSGYVYEAVPTNRLEGVTATVLYLDTGSNTWQVWDAEWFGQQNPQTTDPNGKYGWDVPQGRWKVLYEKEGYESRYSWEMDVPPPHFDVNVGLVSLSAPTVTAVTPVSAGETSFIDITFSQYMRVSSLIDTAITVMPTGENAEPVVGTIEAVSPVQGENQEWLTRTIRFNGAGNLVQGAVYQVTVDQFVQNYAGRSLAAEQTRSVTMPVQDSTPPAISIQTPVPNSVLSHGMAALEAQVSDASGVDPSSIILTLDGTPVAHTFTGGRVSYNAPEILADGLHTVTLTARDMAGNAAETSGWRFTVDTAGPVLTVVTAPGNVTGAGNVSITVTSSEPLKAAPAVTLITPALEEMVLTVSGSGPSWTASLPVTGATPDGRYTVKAVGQDLAGNPGQRLVSFDVAVPPALTVTATPATFTAATTVSLTVISAEALSSAPSIQVTAPGGAVQELTPTADGANRWQATYQVTAESPRGSYLVKVIGQDLSGHTAEKTMTLTYTAPSSGGGGSGGGPITGPGTGNTPEPGTGNGTGNPPDTGTDNGTDTDTDSEGDTDSDTVQVEVGAEPIAMKAFDGIVDLSAPAGSLPEGATLTIRKLEETAQAPGNMTGASAQFDLQADGLAKPLTLRLRYDAAALGSRDHRKLGLYRREANGAWTYVGGMVNQEAGTVSARVMEPGTYALFTYERTFADILAHWGRGEIEVLISRHLVNGINAEEFAPDRQITRAEVAKLLTVMLAQDPARGIKVEAGSTSSFTDVEASAWYHPYVETAARIGLIRGSVGLFRPNDPVTREELAVMIVRALGLEQQVPTADPLQLTDLNQTAPWSHKAVVMALEHGLMRGVSGNTFDPQGEATRAQAAAVILRALLFLEQAQEAGLEPN